MDRGRIFMGNIVDSQDSVLSHQLLLLDIAVQPFPDTQCGGVALNERKASFQTLNDRIDLPRLVYYMYRIHNH